MSLAVLFYGDYQLLLVIDSHHSFIKSCKQLLQLQVFYNNCHFYENKFHFIFFLHYISRLQKVVKYM
jgi:hypothetical protein